VKQRQVVGQDRPRSRPAWTTVRAPSQMAAPAAWRRAVVVRIRAGTAGIASVNELRVHRSSVQYQRVLRQRMLTGRPPQGRCRGVEVRQPVSRGPNTPEEGQARAEAQLEVAWAVDPAAVPAWTWIEITASSARRGVAASVGAHWGVL